MEDGVDYVPADTNVVFGHQFASIAGAGPINGPIQAAIFGWLPVHNQLRPPFRMPEFLLSDQFPICSGDNGHTEDMRLRELQWL